MDQCSDARSRGLTTTSAFSPIPLLAGRRHHDDMTSLAPRQPIRAEYALVAAVGVGALAVSVSLPWLEEEFRLGTTLRWTIAAAGVLILGIAARVQAGGPAGFGYLLKDRVLDPSTFLRQLEEVAAGATVIDPGVLPDAMRGSGRLACLTHREIEVLGLVASGRSNPGIAADLVISRRTVDAHLRSIFTKLGIESDPDGNQRVLAVLNWLGES